MFARRCATQLGGCGGLPCNAFGVGESRFCEPPLDRLWGSHAQPFRLLDKLAPGAVIERDTVLAAAVGFATLGVAGEQDLAGPLGTRAVADVTGQAGDLAQEVVGAGELVHVEDE